MRLQLGKTASIHGVERGRRALEGRLSDSKSPFSLAADLPEAKFSVIITFLPSLEASSSIWRRDVAKVLSHRGFRVGSSSSKGCALLENAGFMGKCGSKTHFRGKI